MSQISTDNIQATYFNGKSAKGYPATIKLFDRSIVISYQSQELGTVQVYWAVEALHSNDVNDNEYTTLKYGEFPFEVLEVHSTNFLSLLQQTYPDAAFLQSNYSWLLQRGHKGVLMAGAFLVITCVLLYWFGLPKLADTVVYYMPPTYEQSLGQGLYDIIISDYDINHEKTAHVNDFFDALTVTSNYDITITVVETPFVNAFAIMGGHIVVFEGIIDKMESYEELAALLGHEFAHVQHRHSARIMLRSLANYMIISLLLNDLNGVTTTILQNAESLKQLSYTRNFETEADQIGLQILLDNYIDPEGMVHLFSRLKSAYDIDWESVAYLSSHPLINKRINYTKEAIDNSHCASIHHPYLAHCWQLIKE